MEIDGLPVHPLVVHAAVVFTPLACLAALLYLVPGLRDRLRWPLLVLALLSVGLIWLAYIAGEDLREDRFATATGAFAEQLDEHEDLASILRWVVSGFGLVAVLAMWLHSRAGVVRVLLMLLLAAGAIATLVYVYLTGDAGTRAVYPPR
ncbi:MAG: hypothetical protein M3237_19565 [Actinomycetota bacterium]|nr:hypothetical protein [Actinomycetota bacterium]